MKELELSGDAYTRVQRSDLQGWGNALIDKKIEKLVENRESIRQRIVLEVGASSGEHLNFINKFEGIKKYVALDLKPGDSNPKLFEELKTKRFPFKLEFVKGNAEQLHFLNDSFDLTFSTCLLAHVNDPMRVFQELRRVTKKGGQIIIAMPCDPGAINRFIKFLFTYPKLRKNGIPNPKLFYALDHKNSIPNLVEIGKHVFRDDDIKLKYYPFYLASWNFNMCIFFSVIVK